MLCIVYKGNVVWTSTRVVAVNLIYVMTGTRYWGYVLRSSVKLSYFQCRAIRWSILWFYWNTEIWTPKVKNTVSQGSKVLWTSMHLVHIDINVFLCTHYWRWCCLRHYSVKLTCPSRKLPCLQKKLTINTEQSTSDWGGGRECVWLRSYTKSALFLLHRHKALWCLPCKCTKKAKCIFKSWPKTWGGFSLTYRPVP